jgi:hypothetical protein
VTAWVCLLGVIFQLRFMQGRWRTMRVIEQAAEPLLEMPSAEERRREWER